MTDASAIVGALAIMPPHAALVRRLAGDPDLHMPHLVDVEFVHAIRRLVRLGDITLDRARLARTAFAALAITRYPHTDLVDRMWELRGNLTACDAAYVALAEVLGAPLVTLDAKLAKSPGHRARVEVL